MIPEKKLKKPLCSLEIGNTILDTAGIKKILPHREPFLLVDKICDVDTAQKKIIATRYIAKNDPVFQGHFPDNPIYPGVLQIEMMGQTGLCLTHFIEPQDEGNVRKGLLVKVHCAKFLDAIRPNETVAIIAKVMELDEYLGVIAAQIICDNRVRSYSILEVYFDE